MPDPIRSLQQLLITNFALNPSGYTGSRGDVGYVGSGGLGYTGSVGPAGAGASVPKITAIAYSGDDTATNPAGGDTITITGSGFASGALVVINGNPASVVSVVNSTTITFTAPANSAGSYIVYVVNTDGTTALLVPGIQYSANPTWTTTAGTLGSVVKQTSFTANLVASGDAPITYSLYSGTLPTGLTLAANTGVISGTAPNVASSTTYSFTVRSTDAQQQDTDRAFSITVVPLNPTPTVEYLVVAGGAGGGGGGGSGGGGGGAGGFRTATGLSISSGTPITVTVGGGGTGGPDGGTNGTNGGNSVFASITSLGGGGGGAFNGANLGKGLDGGSGGGGGCQSYDVINNYGLGTDGQGYRGGRGRNAGSGQSGGGGGAGYAGGDVVGGIGVSAGSGGNGGAGLASSITGTSTYYAGGGGGGAQGGNTGSAGIGGGGAGGYQNAFSGTANTGGGGGGGNSGNGGSGIVIIRYSDAYSDASATTGSPTLTTTGGYKIYTWTTSGSITF